MFVYKECTKPDRLCTRKYNKSQRGFYRRECSCGGLLKTVEIKVETLNDDFFVSIEGVEKDNSSIEGVEKNNSSIEGVEKNNSSIEGVEKNNYPIVVQEELASPFYSVDSEGYIHFIEFQEEETVNADKLVIYLDGKIYKEVPLEYDETCIGRKSLWINPDVDLSEIDPNNYVSRKHLMIYRENGNYFARNLSTKNSVHIEKTALKQDESIELKHEDLIILSRYVVMVFKKRLERN